MSFNKTLGKFVFQNFTFVIKYLCMEGKVNNYKFPNQKEYEPHQLLNAGQIMTIIMRMIYKSNNSVGLDCCRTAYVAMELTKQIDWDDRINLQNVILLSILKAAGFYHFDAECHVDISTLSSVQLKERYTYSYVYIKNLTPIGNLAQTLLFYNTKYNSGIAQRIVQMEYASIVFAAERIVQMLKETNFNYSSSDFNRFGLQNFNQKYIETFKALDYNHIISDALKPKKKSDGSVYYECFEYLEKLFKKFEYSEEETNQFFKLMIVMLDFKSTVTVWHTIHTASYAVSLGKYYGCDADEINKLFTAGVLHDLGKIMIPRAILEFPGKLSRWEYKVVQKHVEYTYELIGDVVPKEICNMAVRHHERLNGLGYPLGLSAKNLTKLDRIIEVADVLSALVDRRSYKLGFDENEVLKIFSQMVEKGELDGSITKFVTDCFELLQVSRDRYSSLLILPIGTVVMEYQEEMDATEEAV